MLGPRLGRYANGLDPLPLGNPVNACMGLFVLWWGWLAFNSGSTYGISGIVKIAHGTSRYSGRLYLGVFKKKR
jgi:ammonia channel protein AmtB